MSRTGLNRPGGGLTGATILGQQQAEREGRDTVLNVDVWVSIFTFPVHEH